MVPMLQGVEQSGAGKLHNEIAGKTGVKKGVGVREPLRTLCLPE